MRQLLRSALRDYLVEVFETRVFVECGEIVRWVVSELLEFLSEREVGRVVIVVVSERTGRRCGGWRRSDWDVEC